MPNLNLLRVSRQRSEHASNIINLACKICRIYRPTVKILTANADRNNPIPPVLLNGSQKSSFLGLVVDFGIDADEDLGVRRYRSWDSVCECVAGVGGVEAGRVNFIWKCLQEGESGSPVVLALASFTICEVGFDVEAAPIR